MTLAEIWLVWLSESHGPLSEGWTNSLCNLASEHPMGSAWNCSLAGVIFFPLPILLLWIYFETIPLLNHTITKETMKHNDFWVPEWTHAFFIHGLDSPPLIYFELGLMSSFGQWHISMHNANRCLISLHALECIFFECSFLEPRREAKPTWKRN